MGERALLSIAKRIVFPGQEVRRYQYNEPLEDKTVVVEIGMEPSKKKDHWHHSSI